MFQWILLCTLAVNSVFAYTDKNVLQCLRANGLTNFVQLLEESGQASQLTGTGTEAHKIINVC